MKKIIAIVMLLGFGSAQAALVDRGGGFIYDDVLDVTWLQDANYAKTSGYDADGQMSGDDAIDWVSGLSVYDSIRGVTWDDWRLPTTAQPDTSCSTFTTYEEWEYGDPPGDPSAGQGWGSGCTGSEMGHLYNVDGGQLGLFINLPLSGDYYSTQYWSSTRFPWDSPAQFTFSFAYGYQSPFGDYENDLNLALAVRDGDVAASVVPIPAAVWLFGSGLGLLGWLRRRRTV